MKELIKRIKAECAEPLKRDMGCATHEPINLTTDKGEYVVCTRMLEDLVRRSRYHKLQRKSITDKRMTRLAEAFNRIPLDRRAVNLKAAENAVWLCEVYHCNLKGQAHQLFRGLLPPMQLLDKDAMRYFEYRMSAARAAYVTCNDVPFEWVVHNIDQCRWDVARSYARRRAGKLDTGWLAGVADNVNVEV